MKIHLLNINKTAKPIINQLLVDYLSELGTILQEKIWTENKYLDSYFTEENRKAYFIKLKNEIIDFAFVNDHCIIKTNEIAIAEFYIKPEFRNNNFGLNAFKLIVQQSSLKWEIKTSIKNAKGKQFWRKAVSNLVFSFNK